MLTEEEIMASKGNPALLDRLAISTPRGQLMGMFGLGSELYIEPRNHVQLRLDMLDVQEDYYQLFQSYLDRMYYDSEAYPDGRWATLKKGQNPFPWIREAIGDFPSDRGYASMIFKRYTHPDFPGDAHTVTPWSSNFYVSNDNELSNHWCYMPVANDKGELHFDVLRDKVLIWATRLRPVHGLAGFTVVLESGAISGEPYAYTYLQTHPGLNIETSDFPRESRDIFNRIKCINWLTILGDAIVDELGGLDAARKALEPDCTLYPYPGGLMIQAGPVPQLGDTTKGIVPERYRKVARFTKPVRFTGYRSSLFRVFKPMIAREEAEKWVSRFD